MKNTINITTKPFVAIVTAVTFALAIGTPGIQAEEKDHKDHDHDHAAAGPNGGKVIHAVEPHLEFFVTKDRKVQITALGEDGKAIPMSGQVVRVTGGSRSNPTRMSFTKSGKVLISDTALPEGNDFPIVVQIKPKSDAKTVIEKFNLNLSDCPTCDYKEYACTCDHGDDKDHKKKK